MTQARIPALSGGPPGGGFQFPLVVAILLGLMPAGFGQTPAPVNLPTLPGLALNLASLEGGQAKASDIISAPNVWLYVPAGKSASPFMPGGKFAAVWEGSVTADAAGSYQFQAELNGALKVEVNGETALEVNGAGGGGAPGKLMRLNRGLNPIQARFTSPAEGDAWVRLQWKPKDGLLQPIPLEALTRAIDAPGLKQAEQLHLGRELFVEFRCAKCHGGPPAGQGMPELGMDAPDLAGIGARRNYGWLARWIQDPQALRPTAHMPRLLHGAEAKADAEAVAAYLVSPEMKAGAESLIASKPELAVIGKNLFAALHCEACHDVPGAKELNEKKISLRHVRDKFVDGALAVFLLKPEVHYAWIRMPNFKLSEPEANQLTAFLLAEAEPPQESNVPANAEVIARGKKLVQTAGCLNCHNLKLENQFTTRKLADLSGTQWQRGCLEPDPVAGSAAPRFGFNATQREALAAFGATDRSALLRHVPAEFAERQTRALNCRECHGKFEGFPVLDLLGGKLKPEWSRAFIGGEVAYRPRPWLDARMPAFRQRADDLAQGLAMLHGYPPETATESSIDMAAAEVGQKLVSMVGGFSCVSCHAVNEAGAAQVFQTPGVNLAHSSERLLKPYFLRWVRNPQLVDPSTKMPVYFDEEGKSPLADVLGGDGAKQLQALWEYLRLGDKMPAPPTP